MFPAARITDLTITGDTITGPGASTVMIGYLTASVVGDMVSGAACIGAIVMGSMSVVIEGRPAARLTSQVAGVNPASGAPVTTMVGPPCCPTVLIGG